MHQPRLEVFDDERRQITARSFASSEGEVQLLGCQFMGDRVFALKLNSCCDAARKITRQVVKSGKHKFV